MEKLIELLNEYEKDKIKNSEGLDVMYVWKYEGTLHYYNNYKDENIFDNVMLLIISKGYRFIERLVDNDKIDQFYYENSVRVKRYIDEYEEYDYVFPIDYKQLIMLLSIEDNPIEWLCSILK